MYLRRRIKKSSKTRDKMKVLSRSNVKLKQRLTKNFSTRSLLMSNLMIRASSPTWEIISINFSIPKTLMDWRVKSWRRGIAPSKASQF